ncbi:MAG: dihydrolipoamide acetyltransferase family protein [Balneolaceae bacterium]
MGESVVEGTVNEWLKKVGDKVEEDESLLEIATDKVDTEIPSPASGTLAEILAEEGETIEVGQTIAIITTGTAAAASEPSKQKKEKKEETAGATPSANGAPAGERGKEPQRVGSDGRFYSPLVRSIAREEGISQEELEKIEGSGQGDRVSKEDILAYVEERESRPQPTASADSKSDGLSQPASRPSGEKGKISAGELNIRRPSENVEIIKMDRMRKMIADHMIRSKQTSAHVTTFTEVDVTNVVRWRERNKKEFQERAGTKLTFTPLFLEAIIQGIREYPLLNSSLDTEKEEIILKRDINFGIAVALGEGGKGGLIVPVIKQAQDKNLVGLAKEVSELAEKARSKNLNPDDLVGGTITLTNYGSVGNLMGTPIINQPQVAIIGTGAIQKRPVVIETEGGDMIAIRHMMYLSMSYDHRIVDGAHGGAFLNRIKQLLEEFDPDRAV